LVPYRALDESLDASILDALATLEKDCGGFNTTAALPTPAPPLSAQEIAIELGLPALDSSASDSSAAANDFLNMTDLDFFAVEQLDTLDTLDTLNMLTPDMLTPVVPDVSAAPTSMVVPSVFEAACSAILQWPSSLRGSRATRLRSRSPKRSRRHSREAPSTIATTTTTPRPCARLQALGR
jgi:hypothetical protein